MKPIVRYTGTIIVTTMIAFAAAAYLIGAPAEAQPAPAPPNGAVPAPAVQPVEKGAASSSAPGQPTPDKPGVQAGDAATQIPPAPAPPPATAKPSIAEVPCAGAVPSKTLKGVVNAEVETNSVIKFEMPAGVDGEPDNAASAGLELKPGQATCLRFAKAGTFLFHSSGKLHGAITARAWYDIEVEQEVQDLKGGNFWMPDAVNQTAEDSDVMYYSVLGLSAFFFTAITAAVVYFVIKYRHRPGHKAEPSAAHNDALEVTWTVIPTIICVFLFYYGWNTYVRVVTPPTKAVEINVLAWRWNWQFTHSNGVTDSDLHVPVGTPVRLVMTSKDVLHSFYAPVMRVKQDIIPRRYTYAWFFPTKPGVYRLTCAEYCGTNHSQMGITNDGRRAVLVVHKPGDYERYLSDKASESTALPPEQLGKMLYEKKGCNACHTVDGSARVGPSWKGTFGTTVPLSDGTSVKMDESYIIESINFPQAKSRPGFPPSMPSFQGQLKQVEIEGLIAYIKSLK
jgi:cytochrome c oxidase subunit 2